MIVTMFRAVIEKLDDQSKRIDGIKAALNEMGVEVTDAADGVNALLTRAAEIHAGVESLYLDDIDNEDKTLADVVKRISV